VRGLVRPLRFLLVSVPAFLAWEWFLRQPYLTALAYTFAGTARLAAQHVYVGGVRDGRIEFAYHGVAWTDEFGMTGINTVALASLTLATGPVTWRRRLQMLGIGLGWLFVTQVLGLWTDLVHVHLHDNPSMAGFANGLRGFMTGFGTFLFPLLIWLWLVRDHLPIDGAARGAAAAPP